jgi:uncharacterized protein (TIGR02145 family)
MFVLITAGLLFSCNKEPLVPKDSLNSDARFELKSATNADCKLDCIIAGSKDYFEKTGIAKRSSGPNTKQVSYSAYNTEETFVVEVTYAIITGKSKSKATITVNIDGNMMVFAMVASGTTVKHSIALREDWARCDEVSFKIFQEGLGTPIEFAEVYGLFPVCSSIPSVSIGTQTWMQYNLDISTYRNGDPIRHAQTEAEWQDASAKGEGAWVYYNNDPANGAIYGKLYNWYAVNDSRGLAPEGWHVPTDVEWLILTDYLGGGDFVGGKLKSASGWYDSGNGNNSSGFSGLPGGYRYYDGDFRSSSTYDGFWWSSTEYETLYVWHRSLSHRDNQLYRNYFIDYAKEYGLSVRCVKD